MFVNVNQLAHTTLHNFIHLHVYNAELNSDWLKYDMIDYCVSHDKSWIM